MSHGYFEIRLLSKDQPTQTPEQQQPHLEFLVGWYKCEFRLQLGPVWVVGQGRDRTGEGRARAFQGIDNWL